MVLLIHIMNSNSGKRKSDEDYREDGGAVQRRIQEQQLRWDFREEEIVGAVESVTEMKLQLMLHLDVEIVRVTGEL
ncbi:hypothetical protein C5167_045304 [Papaver somniferum]|uniref:Uncharacterized protein n=1 Tax=Papaver somniferum TaxID=3469 RepID=A0A4Y7LEC5_PAPSO|nr:hypothetical protein C5167_045304 [Papaver somniferum]